MKSLKIWLPENHQIYVYEHNIKIEANLKLYLRLRPLSQWN